MYVCMYVCMYLPSDCRPSVLCCTLSTSLQTCLYNQSAADANLEMFAASSCQEIDKMHENSHIGLYTQTYTYLKYCGAFPVSWFYWTCGLYRHVVNALLALNPSYLTVVVPPLHNTCLCVFVSLKEVFSGCLANCEPKKYPYDRRIWHN